MNLGVSEPAGRLAITAFGIVFSAVAIIGVADGARGPSPLGVAIGAAMLVAGLWFIATGVVGVPMRSGEFAGGGPGFSRIKLEPDEPIIGHCWGRGGPPGRGSFLDKVAPHYWMGELILTDRRIILAAWRLELWTKRDPPFVWIPLRDVVEMRDSDGGARGFFGAGAVEAITTAEGQVYSAWFSDRGAVATLRELLARRDGLPRVHIQPRRSTRTTGAWLLRDLPGVIAVAGIAGLTLGQTSWPYVGEPRRDYLLIWIVPLAVGVHALWRYVQKRRARTRIEYRG